jgi:conjugal transfer mating pair stabilization protein TraN
MRALAALFLFFASVSPAAAQQSVRDDAGIFVKPLADAAVSTADDENAAASNLPGYNGGNAPERTYLDNAPALDAAKVTAARSNQASALVIDGAATRPQVPGALVDETVARGEIINQDPSTYARGVDAGGNTGTCVPLPPATSSPGTFEATCNSGSQVVDEVRSCSPVLVTEIIDTNVYKYYAEVPLHTGLAPAISEFSAALAGGTCTTIGTADTCQVVRDYGLRPTAQCARFRTDILQCNAPVSGLSGFLYPATGQKWFARDVSHQVTVRRDDSVCNALNADPECSFTGPEICTDSDPQTRDVSGTPVTQPCWGWRRDYQCHSIRQANDCTALDTNAACHFARTECLDDPQNGTCLVEERIYTCPIPGSASAPQQYLCGGDLYCIGGECEAVTREASDEFKDAVVGLESLAQAKREFTDIDFKLFKGNVMGCHKPIFGLVNCCAGKSSGLIGTSAGFAALAGGPAAIGLLATPLLTAFLCSPAEKEFDVRDRMGLCHKVGTYCSSSFFGICTAKRTNACCFLSKLTRILQEQGRAQLGKSWGPPKTPDCAGFTVDEFAALDLSKMDFTEVYKEFVDAAKLPGEAAAMTDIQAKIQAYYARGGPK